MNKHYIGLGGAGANIIQQMIKAEIEGKYTIINAINRPQVSHAINFIEFTPPGIKLKNGDGVFILPDYDAKLVVPESVTEIIKTSNNCVLIAGLGQYTGTNLTNYFIEKFRIQHKQFRAIATIPFVFEDQARERAFKLVYKLSNASQFIPVDLENIIRKYGHLHLKIGDLFSAADGILLNLALKSEFAIP